MAPQASDAEEKLLDSSEPPPTKIIIPAPIYSPAKFNEDHPKYRVFCHSLHITRAAPIFVAIRCSFYFVFVLRMALGGSALVVSSCVFSWIVLLMTVASLLAALKLEHFALLIPALFLSLLIVFLLALYTFVNFLELTNLRGELGGRDVLVNFFLLLVLLFEMYFLAIVWCCFVYICDVKMNKDAHDRRRESRMVKGRVLQTPFKKATQYGSEDEVSVTSLDELRPKSHGNRKPIRHL